MAKILAIDLGEKRVGLAISDELNIIAMGFGFLDREIAFEKIVSIIAKEKVEKVVVGLPKLASGDLGSQATDIQDFTGRLISEINVPIEYENEILTSVEAEKRLKEIGRKVKDKGEIDEMSAVIILETYLRRE